MMAYDSPCTVPGCDLYGESCAACRQRHCTRHPHAPGSGARVERQARGVRGTVTLVVAPGAWRVSWDDGTASDEYAEHLTIVGQSVGTVA